MCVVDDAASSSADTSSKVWFDMDTVYEGHLVSGTAAASVVSGTVEQVPGRYGAGLRLPPGSLLLLGKSDYIA